MEYLQGTNQPEVRTQRVQNGRYVSVPIKHLEIRVAGSSGMRGHLRSCLPLRNLTKRQSVHFSQKVQTDIHYVNLVSPKHSLHKAGNLKKRLAISAQNQVRSIFSSII